MTARLTQEILDLANEEPIVGLQAGVATDRIWGGPHVRDLSRRERGERSA